MLQILQVNTLTNIAGIEKYVNNPTSTSLDTRDYPVWNIDFPGVTICPNTKVSAFKVNTFDWIFPLDNEKQFSNSYESKISSLAEYYQEI